MGALRAADEVEARIALYGERWQTELAAAIGISDRTVRRWVAGTDEPKSGVYVDLLRLAVERAAELDELIALLKRAGAPEEP